MARRQRLPPSAGRGGKRVAGATSASRAVPVAQLAFGLFMALRYRIAPMHIAGQLGHRGRGRQLAPVVAVVGIGHHAADSCPLCPRSPSTGAPPPPTPCPAWETRCHRAPARRRHQALSRPAKHLACRADRQGPRAAAGRGVAGLPRRALPGCTARVPPLCPRGLAPAARGGCPLPTISWAS
jgi:hypothetical protein